MIARARRAAAVALALALAGCAGLPGFGTAPAPARLKLAPPPAAFHLEGRVSVKAEAESFSGGLTWRRDGKSQELLLRTPLGQGVAELRGNVAGMTLTDAKGRVYRATDPDALARQALGVELPLRGLEWWVVGHPRPDAKYRARTDADGHLVGLAQDGWDIDFSRHVEVRGYRLPGRLVARRGDALEVRLVVDDWELP